MEDLYINDYPDLVFYPVIDFKYNTGICEISGESYMEESYNFYEPVIKWLVNYMKERKDVNLNIKLTYFNTSSSRIILEIFDLLKDYIGTGGNVQINWYYKKEDPDMLKEITDFRDEIGIDIVILPFP